MKKKRPAIAIVGPTASGKTSLAVKLAQNFKGEIISADSRQVYRGMDIGTGKDLSEYNFLGSKGEKLTIPHYLIDVCQVNDRFDLAKYLSLANEALTLISSKQKLPIICGGSGLYVQALIDNYQISLVGQDNKKRLEWEKLDIEDLLKKIKTKSAKFFEKLNQSERGNKRRLIRYLEILESKSGIGEKREHPKFDFLVLALDMERNLIKEKILSRLKERLEKENMIVEIEELHKQGASWSRLEGFGLEYKYVSLYLQKKLSYKEMEDKLYQAICRFSKRQMTWLRRWERQGREIHWLKSYLEANEKIEQFLKNY
jgi:tRNA dimethylallyltransferase